MFLAGLGAATYAPAQTPKKPNVVFFMTDDHGAWALGHACEGIHTPNIDRLAAEGLRFTRAFAATPVCSPSRATYYTGKLPTHHGVQDFLMGEDSYGPESKRFLDGHRTYADELTQAGYQCALVGKWHLGGDTEAQAGFTYWSTSPRGSGPYKDVPFYRNGEELLDTGYKTDFVGDEAVHFLNQHGADGPFCLTVPFFAPHDPFDYQPEEDRAHYAESDFACFPEPPDHPQRRGRHSVHLRNRQSKIGFSALVTSVDRQVGKVLDKLEAMGLRDDTIVIFSADQGYNCGHHGFWGKGNGTIPFNLYEESIQVPLIWHWPGRIEAGETSAMVSSYDFFPTLLDYLGVKARRDEERVGRSYAAFLRGESPDWRTELFFEFGYVRGIRTENLKYVERGDGWGDELFDLEADPGEEINRIGKPQYRERRLALRKRLHAYFDGIGAPAIDDWRETTTQKLPTDAEGYYEWIESVRKH